MAKDKRKKNKKKLYKLRKRRPYIALILFLITGILMITAMSMSVEVFTTVTLNSKLSGEQEKADLIASFIDSKEDMTLEELTGLLEPSGFDYVLKDSSGSIVAQRGEDTCALETESDYIPDFYGTGSVRFTSEDDDRTRTGFTYFEDSENKMLSFDKEGYVKVDLLLIFRTARKELKEKEIVGSDPEEMAGKAASDVRSDFIRAPFWMSKELPNGMKLYLKAYIRASLPDVLFIIVLLIALIVIIAVMFFIMLFNVIGTITSQRRMTRLAFDDIVTKGHNRMWFTFKGDQTLRRRRNAWTPYAVADITFMNYRRFCSCHSLEEGESVLLSIQDKINEFLDKNELCSHSSDDSFALLLRMEDEPSLKNRIGQILHALETIDSEHSFTFHAGVSFIPPAEKVGLFKGRIDVDIDREYNNACTARASLEGSDSSSAAYFDDKFIEDQKWIDTVEELQQQALDNEEFIVYYQPKYDPRTNELRGAEALIRWQSPVHGFITPYKFIPIFEKNGFITNIDHYMISHAARDQRRWLDMGYECVPISVNVSRAHFIESDLAEQIRDMVDKEGTPHRLIEIELTESAFFDDKNAMINTIEKLKQNGFSVSMDDFGSGYSSLNSLKDMPLDVLKLDAEFFRGEQAGTDRGEKVVSEAIKLAKSLNMRTVAEGVEIKEQVDFLASQGCDMIQGYYFAKPMPGSDFEERMRRLDKAPEENK